MEAETGEVAEAAHAAFADGGSQRRRRILDNRQAVGFRDLDNGVDIRSEPNLIDRHDRARARANRGLDERGIDVVGSGIDVDEDGCGAGVDDSVCCGDE